MELQASLKKRMSDVPVHLEVRESRRCWRCFCENLTAMCGVRDLDSDVLNMSLYQTACLRDVWRWQMTHRTQKLTESIESLGLSSYEYLLSRTLTIVRPLFLLETTGNGNQWLFYKASHYQEFLVTVTRHVTSVCSFGECDWSRLAII